MSEQNPSSRETLGQYVKRLFRLWYDDLRMYKEPPLREKTLSEKVRDLMKVLKRR